MQKAFTMIEIIFTIVIIGILTSIALPMLIAMREDAKVTATAQNIANAANEIVTFTIAQGKSTGSMSEMSTVVQSMITDHAATLTDNTLNIQMNTIENCLQLKITDTAANSHISLLYGNAGTDRLCISLQNLMDRVEYHIPLNGQIIKR